jgi:hypothetical protein
MMPDTGITTSYTSAGDVGTGGMGRSGASGTGYTESGVGGGVATLRKVHSQFLHAISQFLAIFVCYVHCEPGVLGANVDQCCGAGVLLV